MDLFSDQHSCTVTPNNIAGFDDPLMTPIIGEFSYLNIRFVYYFTARNQESHKIMIATQIVYLHIELIGSNFVSFIVFLFIFTQTDQNEKKTKVTNC